MADAYPSLVKGITGTAGTGTYTVGISSGTPYRSLAQAVADGSLVSGDKVMYVARDPTVLNDASFELGEGTFTVAAGPTYQVSRDTIHDGSNGPGTPVSWGASGQRDFYLTSTHPSVIARTDRSNTFDQSQNVGNSTAVTNTSVKSSGGAGLILYDAAASADNKNVQLESAGAIARIRSLTDALAHKYNFLGFDIANSRTGVGTLAPDGTLHVQTASAGVVSPNAGVDDLTVENSASGGISILTPDANFGQIGIGSPSNNLGTLIRYSHDGGELDIGTNQAGAEVVLRSGAFDEAFRIDANGFVVVNENGDSDKGLRVEGDTDVNLLYTDPANNSVGFGTNAPDSSYKVEMVGNLLVTAGSGSGQSASAIAPNIVIDSDTGAGLSILTPNNSSGSILFGDSDSATKGQISYSHNSDVMTILANGNPITLNSTGLRIGSISGATSPLHINLPTENLTVDDAGSTAATEQDWIEVTVGGNTGYLRVFATK